MRVVADSNVVISALVFGGAPKLLLEVAGRRQIALIASEAILSEIAIVLVRKFRWSPERTEGEMSEIRRFAEIVSPGVAISAGMDPDDDRILEAAVGGNAQFIATGDGHLLRMRSFEGIEIGTVRSLLDRLRAEVKG